MSSPAEDFAGVGAFLYHVPQHSRREKLRYPPEESPVTATSSLPLFYQSGASFLPSSCYNHSFNGCVPHQIPSQGFSLSLSPAAVGPLGPFTGYASVLNRSGFFEPARQLLEEICRLGRGEFSGVGSRDPPESFAMESEVQKIGVVGEGQWKKLKLVSMLDEVYKRYRLYYQQIETVIASFEAVAGLNTAVPYVSMALKSMSKSFICLKSLISTHLTSLSKVNGEEGLGKGENGNDFGMHNNTCSQRRNFSLAFGQPQHAWRPQRGLPERAVAVLRAWLFDHFLHPYPTDSDKQMLAKQTGLTRNQVSNWFINARVRLWKPMVEEIHNLEVHQSQKALAADHNVHTSSMQPSHPQPPSPAAASSSNRPPAETLRQQSDDLNESRRNSNRPMPHFEEPYRFVFNDFSGHGNSHSAPGIGNSAISLSLGLPEQLPVNVARRFGLEECSNAYVVRNGYEGQERGYGKEIGAHMVHDFVG